MSDHPEAIARGVGAPELPTTEHFVRAFYQHRRRDDGNTVTPRRLIQLYARNQGGHG